MARSETVLFRVAGLLVLTLLLTSQRSTLSAHAAPGTLNWAGCGSFECATLAVPLDYANPAGRQIELALIRQKAKDPANRIGSLLVDPGGPGGSGVEFLRQWAPVVARDVQNRFDLIGFDPRGVGQSTPLLCHDEIQKFAGLEPRPRSDAQWQSIFAVTKGFADLCAQRSDGMLPFLGSVNVVRDMDAMRQALGDAKLTYVGFSYGTVLGQVYADMFPDKVRAIVLDGPEDLSGSADQLSLTQARAFEGALDHFISNCRVTSCLPSNRGDPAAAIEALLNKAETEPIPAPRADRPAGPGETTLAIFQAMYSPRIWSQLARAIDSGLGGDGTGLIRLADDYLERRPDGTYTNIIDMYTAVSCVDFTFSRDPAYYQRLAEQFTIRAPHFGVLNLEAELPCAFWGAPPTPLHPPTAKGAPPILVVGTTGDPATPYESAVAVSKQLESATLLTFNGEGHTAYTQGNSCIDAAVGQYLLSLQMPRAGMSCGDAGKVAAISVTDPGATPIPVPANVASAPPATPIPPPDISRPPVVLTTHDRGGNRGIVLAGVVLAGVLLGGLAFGVVMVWRRL